MLPQECAADKLTMMSMLNMYSYTRALGIVEGNLIPPEMHDPTDAENINEIYRSKGEGF